MFLYGRNSVFERLKNNPKTIKRVFLQDNFSDLEIKELIKVKRVSSKSVSKKELYRIKNADSLQGVVAEVEEFQYPDLADLINKDDQLSFIFLDRILDPQNLGSIIRTTACLGGFAIAIPKHRACEVTEATLRVASGGENFVPILKLTNFTNTLLELKKSGFWIGGTFPGQGQNLASVDLPFPLAIVLGSEGQGIRYGLKKHLDLKLQIPMEEGVPSLNIASACAIFCYEVVKQRKLW